MNAHRPPVLLTIDDEPGMRSVIMGAAELEGYSVREAGSKKDILNALNEPADVIVLDVSMPDMDGIEVIWELVRRQHKARLVILSGFDPAVLDAAEKIAIGSELDVVACLAKPVEVSKLREMLSHIKGDLAIIDEVA